MVLAKQAVLWLLASGLSLALGRRAQPIDAKVIHVFNPGKTCSPGTMKGTAQMSGDQGTVEVTCSYEDHSYSASIALYPGRLTGACCYVPDQDVFLFVQDQRTEPLTNYSLDGAICCNEGAGQAPASFLRDKYSGRCSYGSVTHGFPTDFNQDLVTKCCWSTSTNEWTVHFSELQKHIFLTVPLTQKIKTMQVERADFHKAYMELTVSVTWGIPLTGGTETNRKTIRFNYGKNIDSAEETKVSHNLGWYQVTTSTRIDADGKPEFLLHWDSWLFSPDLGRPISSEKGTDKVEIPAGRLDEIAQFLSTTATLC
ncbi:TPA_exp: Uncharacterized protein A8136_3743 [Trichophyton benhamiae CBS 112371]|uniref:Uncharacterized protein n=2 Tax=Trichophyton TaxID=5550 RepID=D4B1C2_ARTBC|nr:uncharacterized protein ARB_02251 [Trichophyton benhamiae CBS 112371]XP_003018039.1 uncharacterized protein TRV_07963 [Trichophyton verrucosum HKI 0517]EFE31057.1 hypothetical protein ARB_02251 [Trichophyton benhamiae CBS 112371]EFE37394.1 hypothetical protein TRV_07963 [Trichophyton verrucosum HKI 0517]DAA74245.1 TPA_exp: Uncharacterized protein A8136_3743 [Trichophyton benhamiae CBS 112371]